MQFTEQQIKRRLENVQDIIANQRLEGYEVDARTIEDLRREARGEITIEEALARAHKRIADGDF